MAERNIILSVNYNGEMFTDSSEGFAFKNTSLMRFKVHFQSTYLHLKERMEKKLGLPVGEIIHRHPFFSGENGSVFYVMKVIETDVDVKSMFQCHSTFPQLNAVELYARIETDPTQEIQTYPTQETYTQQYGEAMEEEISQNNEPFILNEEVGEYSDDEIEEPPEVRMEDLFGDIGSGDEEDVPPPSHAVYAEPINLYNPPTHLQNISIEDEQQMSVFGECIPTHVGDDMYEGMEFDNKDACVYAIKYWRITNNLDYTVYKSDNTRYIIRCKNPTCSYECRASIRKKNSKWVIAKIHRQHTCTSTSMSQDHRKLNSKLIMQSIRQLVDSDPSIKVKVIIAHITEKFGYIVSYRKAWIAKVKAIESLYGNWETSYNDLMQWLLVMKTFLPGTIIDLQTLPAFTSDGTQLGNKRIFHRLFWAFQPCINAFAYCNPVVQVDGTWLYGRYRGILLMDVAQDGNCNIFPIAFAIVEGEIRDAWSFFLRNLRLHVTPQPNLCIISDKHPSIKSAYDDPANGWQHLPSKHVYCIRHVTQNFQREIKDNELCKTVLNMGCALIEATFNHYRGKIRRSEREDALNWIDNIPREKWARAYDGGSRWGHMTSNMSESYNSVLKATRNLPITALVQATYFRMGSLFGTLGRYWTKKLASSQALSDLCKKGMDEEMKIATTHNVMHFDRENFYFMVAERINHNDGRPLGTFCVDLRKRTCDCGKFQAFHLPCSHAIAACASIRQDYTIHIPEVFTTLGVFKVYKESFLGVPHEENWPEYTRFTLCHDESMRRRKKGRPTSTRIRTEMDVVEKEKRRCGICREIGHMRSKCPNVAEPSNRP